MNVKLTGTRLITFFMILLVFLDMEPYFVWNQVSSVGYTFYTSVIFLTTILMSFVMFTKTFTIGANTDLTDRNRVPFSLVISSFGFIILILYQMFLSGVVTTTNQPFNMPMICIYIGLMMFCLQDNIFLQKVYLVSKKIFAIVLIPAILIYVFEIVGIHLPSTSLSADIGKTLTGQSYELYMGVAVMLRNAGGELPRLCGLFREPGFVGTIGALYLLGDKITLKKWYNVVILIASVLTFSVAFYIIFVLGFLMKIVVSATTPKKLISGIIAIALVVSAYLVFMNISIRPSSPFAELQSRLEFTEDGLAGDNRMEDEYSVAAYESWLKSDIKTILLGYGKDNRVIPGTNISIWQKASSYKEYIFNYGVLSLVIMIATFLATVLTKYRGVKGINKRHIIVLLLLFILSIYQRYGVCRFFYLCVLFGGASNLALTENELIETQDE